MSLHLECRGIDKVSMLVMTGAAIAFIIAFASLVPEL